MRRQKAVVCLWGEPNIAFLMPTEQIRNIKKTSKMATFQARTSCMWYNKYKKKLKKPRKTLYLAAMYRYSNGQISLSDFKQPVGMNLKENNRWVKKAQAIPWLEIEKRYVRLFTNRNRSSSRHAHAWSLILIQGEKFLDWDR